MRAANASPGCALLVDDEPDTLTTLRDLLVVAGVPDVKTARSLWEAELQLTTEPRPSAVVLDLDVDGSPAEEFLGRLRADPGYASVPVFLLSGDHRGIERLRGAVRGAFLKPADPDVLVRTVVAAVGG